jgi:hypothetical protein
MSVAPIAAMTITIMTITVMTIIMSIITHMRSITPITAG